MNKTEIFVFGSNTQGRHGAGAALYAVQHYGAKYGQARGLQGNSYAIVTKDLNKGRRSIPLTTIAADIFRFIQFAKETQDRYTFKVTAIGCGLAGYTINEIKNIFAQRIISSNVILPKEFL